MTESLKNRMFVLLILVFIIVCLFLYFAREILAPFIIAAFIAYIMYPLVVKLEAYCIKRWVCVVIIGILLLAILTSLLLILIPLLISEFDKLKNCFPEYYEYISNHLVIIKEKLENSLPVLKRYDLYDVVLIKIKEFFVSEAQKIPNYLINIFSIFSAIVLIPMLVLFMLFNADKSINTLMAMLPSRHIEIVLSIVYEMDTLFGRFIRGQLLEASFVGIMSIIFLSVIGVNFALIIGIVAGIANIIPYLGPFVGLFVALLVGIFQFHTIGIVVKILIAYAIIQFLDNNFVQPIVVGRNVNLGPVTMVFAMLTGAQIFGFLGIIFAVPIAAIIKAIFIMLVQKYKTVSVSSINGSV
ncbi:MAG: AI-2E family transporter [Endomicrobium sp.]|jgi:predicted PurR-regulated permease PerM|uniref:AI-2E family transporter n=1 Tax=Candidatus Endomicrobiellum cubanum TaxID=3242325 RepID=UPI00282C5866|nr:AI-2E family transporter [Endomicrobium sp.]